MRIFGKGFNYGQDGPGNRLVYHLSGCNMRCIWCSNADGMSGAAGQDYPVREVIGECLRSRAMFFSGGGVTFTGGEATLQHEELLQALQALRAEGIHTAMETNGTSPRLGELLEYTDYLIMDFKHYDSDILREYTGQGNEVIRANFEANCRSGRQQHIRIPLIKGINTQAPEGFADYFAAFDTENTVFEFLPYHEYGKDKWTTPYRVQDGFVTDDILQQFHAVFRAHGLKIVTT